MKGRRICVCIDESKVAEYALAWALDNAVSASGDELMINTFVSPDATDDLDVMHDAGQSATGHQELQSAVESVVQDISEKAQGAAQLLLWAGSLASDAGVRAGSMHSTALSAGRQASTGVGATIAHFAQARDVDIVVVGCKENGKLGTEYGGDGVVSEEFLDRLPCPVIIVHSHNRPPMDAMATTAASKNTEEVQNRGQATLRKASKTFCFAADRSDQSEQALAWMVQQLMRPSDRLHIVAIALQQEGMQVVGPDGESPGMQKQASDSSSCAAGSSLNSMPDAEDLCKHALQVAMNEGLEQEHLTWQALQPCEGIVGIAEAICNYVQDNEIDVLVLGYRRSSSNQRAYPNGEDPEGISVHCAQSCHCEAVAVFKQESQAAEQEEVQEGLGGLQVEDESGQVGGGGGRQLPFGDQTPSAEVVSATRGNT